jgi:hypothetical protein
MLSQSTAPTQLNMLPERNAKPNASLRSLRLGAAAAPL